MPEASEDPVRATRGAVLRTPPDERFALERAVVEAALLAEDRSLTRVGALAERLGMSVRSVQRLFGEYAGGDLDRARLAADLGFYDQAHLVREFTRTVGAPPARYAAAS